MARRLPEAQARRGHVRAALHSARRHGRDRRGDSASCPGLGRAPSGDLMAYAFCDECASFIVQNTDSERATAVAETHHRSSGHPTRTSSGKTFTKEETDGRRAE